MHYIAFISYICYFATLFCVSAQFHSSTENNIIHLLPAYAVASRASLLGSATCATELRDFLDAVDQRILWGLKTLDSSGELKSGFLYGNNFWLGSRSQCLDIMNRSPFEIAKRHILNNTRYRDPQNEFPPFQLNYFVAYIRHNSTLQYHINMFTEDLITLGLCLPASCSRNNISFILEGIFRDRILLVNDLYSVDLNLIQVKDLKDDHQWLLNEVIRSTSSYTMLSYLPHKNNTCTKKFMILMQYVKHTIVNNFVTLTVGLVLTFAMIISGTIYDIFIYQTYLKTKTKTVSIPIQVISNASLAVDTYFFLSGFLLAYTYLKHKTDKERIKPIHYREKLNEFFVSIIKRYIRLTPAYVMMIGIAQLISSWYDKTSQFYIEERQHEICAKYWWRNVLYIHNLFEVYENILILSYIQKRNFLIIVILCWTLGAACNILVLFGLYKRQISVLSTAIYVALSRTVWAIGIASIVIMCCTEHGDIVKKLLSCKIWIPLSRLTYCAYLLNPFIIRSISLHSEISVHFEFLSVAATVIGYLVINYFCAYALYLMAESPYILLMQMFSQSQQKKK
ncbi:Nose resistant to fluoxetine protein 6 [Trachymyrmex septentrionalis]|uniref:Nose resistant to fluoxetine protein 6 n=1 Tax=Trachymyrmex septentrionalis TaxID=34720 RepID=A0A195ERT4_9HYME|nr:Nose resistant to fluoxetine protein 6 [Trachymyrmex septentrionalis]